MLQEMVRLRERGAKSGRHPGHYAGDAQMMVIYGWRRATSAVCPLWVLSTACSGMSVESGWGYSEFRAIFEPEMQNCSEMLPHGHIFKTKPPV